MKKLQNNLRIYYDYIFVNQIHQSGTCKTSIE